MTDWAEIFEDDPATFPLDDGYVLLSFENCAIPMIGRCEGSAEDGYSFYAGDDDEPLISFGIVVNAWMHCRNASGGGTDEGNMWKLRTLAPDIQGYPVRS